MARAPEVTRASSDQSVSVDGQRRLLKQRPRAFFRSVWIGKSSRDHAIKAEAKAAGGPDGPGDGKNGATGRQSLLPRRGFSQSCAVILAAVAAAVGIGPAKGAAGATRPDMPVERDRRLKWLAFYGESADEAALSAYDLVVLDPMFQGDLARVGAGNSLCAYLSLGEVRRADKSFERLDPACLLEENPAWPGTWRVDVRQAAWRDFVLRETLPAIRARGFKGLMLDTLDTPPWLEQSDPVANRGMSQASIELVRAIRHACPDMLIVVNRGYAILPHLRPMVDAVLAESLLTSPVPEGGFRWNSPSELEMQLTLLAAAREATPPLLILSLDYWDPADAAGLREIYRRQRALGHQPYVATPLLGEIIPEPG